MMTRSKKLGDAPAEKDRTGRDKYSSKKSSFSGATQGRGGSGSAPKNVMGSGSCANPSKSGAIQGSRRK